MPTNKFITKQHEKFIKEWIELDNKIDTINDSLHLLKLSLREHLEKFNDEIYRLYSGLPDDQEDLAGLHILFRGFVSITETISETLTEKGKAKYKDALKNVIECAYTAMINIYITRREHHEKNNI